MDEATIRKRCKSIISDAGIDDKCVSDTDVLIYRAAYADGQRGGMERAAEVADGLRHENGDYIAKQIRQAAGEVTGG